MGVLEFLCEASAHGGAYPEKREEINTQYNDLMNEFQYVNQELPLKLVLNLLSPFQG